MISYISKPVAPTVEPYKEPIELILNAAKEKQSRYDTVLSSIFAQENDLINLDTLKEEVTKRKDNMVKTMEKDLNSMIGKNFLDPNVIDKAESLFDPIKNDQAIMYDLGVAREHKKNVALYESVMKEDPSIGNQSNWKAAQWATNLYVKSDINDNSAAPYVGLFAPYRDSKQTISKVFKDFGIVEGEKYSTTINHNGVKVIHTKSGMVSEARVLAAVNAALTPEDHYQAMLDGINNYGDADIGQLVSGLSNNNSARLLQNKEASAKLDKALAVYDPDGDGQIDKRFRQGVNATDYMQQFSLLKEQKAYYNDEARTLNKNLEYGEAYSKDGNLSIGNRLSLYQNLILDGVKRDIVTMWAKPEGNDINFEYDDSLAYKESGLNARAIYKASTKGTGKAGKTPKEYDMGFIDVDNDGAFNKGKDIPINKTLGDTPGNEVIKDAEVVKNNPVKGSKTYKVTLANGQTLTRVVNTENFPQKLADYKKIFDNAYGDVKDKNHAIITRSLQDLAYKDGISKVELDKVTGEFDAFHQSYEKIIGDKNLDENSKTEKINALKSTYDNGNQYDVLYNFEKKLQEAGSTVQIEEKIRSFLMNEKGFGKTYKELENPNATFNLSKVMTKDEFFDYSTVAFKSNGAFRDGMISKKVTLLLLDDKSKKELEKNEAELQAKWNAPLEAVYEDIKDLPLKESYTPQERATLFQQIYKSGVINKMNPITAKYVADKILDNSQQLHKQAIDSWAFSYEKEKQEIYKQLVDVDAPIILRFHARETNEQKEDPFQNQVIGVIKSKLSDSQTKVLTGGEWKELDNKSRQTLEDNKPDIQPISYNAMTGEIISWASGKRVKVQLNPDDQRAGLPYGMETEDLLGKTMVLQSVFKKYKQEPAVSNPIQIAKLGGEDIKIAYDGRGPQGLFVAFYGNDIGHPLATSNTTMGLQGQILHRLSEGGYPVGGISGLQMIQPDPIDYTGYEEEEETDEEEVEELIEE
jgi:hypothetical protein